MRENVIAVPDKVSYRVWQVVPVCSNTGPQPQLPLPLNHPFMSSSSSDSV